MSAPTRLLLGARREPGDALRRTWLVVGESGLELVDEAASGPERLALPGGAVEAVFRRYGRPLAANAAIADGDECTIDTPVGRLSAFRYRSPVDVIANDYLALTAPGCDCTAAPALLVVGALRAVAHAAARR